MKKPKGNKTFSHQDVVDMLSSIHILIDTTAEIYNQYNNEPAHDSLAYQEQNSFANPELARDVHYRGILSMESAADHLMVFAESMAEPAKTVAPWTCVRGLLESCAIASWFLDPAIDVQTRVGRCFAFRYTGFIQQIKYFQVGNRQEEIDHARQRIKEVEQQALSLGFARLLNKHNKIDGIAMRMPNITDLIGSTMDREGEYRLLSAVAHGHHWAAHQIGFRVIDVSDDQGQVTKALEKYVHPNVALYAGQIAVTSFAKIIWYLWRLYGWNLKELERLLDTTYAKLRYNPALRFWHSTTK
jgi:hypothetical protein